MYKNIFTEHPKSVGESYGEHFYQATLFSSKLFVASLACLLHGIIPCLFKGTASKTIQDLHDRMILKRGLQTSKKRNCK